MRISAGCRAKRARSRCGVSPVRTLICRIVERHAHAPRHVGDAGQRRAQVALHVHGQRLQRRDIDDRGSRCFVSLADVVQHQPVKAPEKRGQRLAGAGRRKDQRALAARDRRPAQALRRGGRVEDRLEPRRRDRVKAGEGVCFTRPALEEGGLASFPLTTLRA